MTNAIVSKKKLKSVLLGLLFAFTLTSVLSIGLKYNADIFNLIEIVENIEFLELTAEEDHKNIAFNYFNQPYILSAKAHEAQIIGNTTKVSSVPDIPPELS
jgi:hypothetical protein